MNEVKIPNINIPCPNCGNNHFSGFGGGDNKPPYGAIVSAEKESNGSFTLNHSKVLGVAPVFCDKCGYVMLFKEDKI